MNRNLKVAMKGYDGNVLKNDKGEPQMVSDVVGLYLYTAGSKKPLEPADKMRAYRLSVKLQEKPESVNLEAEDITLIKEVISDQLVAGAYGQIVELLERD